MASKKGLVIVEIDGNWVFGKFRGKPIRAKIYCQPSSFGIDNGRVSKFDYEGCGYERGWDRGEEKREIWGPAVAALEKFAQTKRFRSRFAGVAQR